MGSTQILEPIYPWDLEESGSMGVAGGGGMHEGADSDEDGEEFEHPSLENRKCKG